MSQSPSTRQLQRRVERLERRAAADNAQPTEIFRVVVRSVVGPLNLEKSTYRQTLCPDGSLIELIVLDGSTDALAPGAELEAWIARQAARSRRNS